MYARGAQTRVKFGSGFHPLDDHNRYRRYNIVLRWKSASYLQAEQFQSSPGGAVPNQNYSDVVQMVGPPMTSPVKAGPKLALSSLDNVETSTRLTLEADLFRQSRLHAFLVIAQFCEGGSEIVRINRPWALALCYLNPWLSI
jgi:hypothetical protein